MRYIPSIMKSPCAKLTTRMTPKIRARPDDHEGVDAPDEQTRHHVLQQLAEGHAGPPASLYLPACQMGVRVASSAGTTVKGSPPCHCTMIGVAPIRRPRSS